MNKKTNKTRRGFLKKAAVGSMAAIGMPLIGKAKERTEFIPMPTFKKNYSPNDTIRVGCIGMGIMGYNNVRTTVQIPGVELAAVCDLYDGRLTSSKENFGDHIKVTKNWKEIIDDKSIDAVIIATSDHWHIPMGIAAVNAGKAVYCEKPMVHKIEEGQAMLKAEKKNNAVFQVGSQRVSSILYHKAKEIYERGDIGQLILVETWNDRQSSNGAWQYAIPTDASPKTIDWEGFLGSAPKREFDKVRFFHWRNYQDYGTGVAGDLFVHLFSGMHLVLSSNGPERIFATGGLRYWDDGRDVPDVMIGCCDYPETSTHPAFNVQIRVNFVDGKGGGSMQRFVGTDGVMEVGWSTITVKRKKLISTPSYGGWDSFGTFSKQQQKDYEKWYKENYGNVMPQVIEPSDLVYRTPEGYSDNYHHHMNFYDSIRNGTKVIEDVAYGLRAAGPSLAMNTSYFGKKPINWDPNKMMVV